MIFDGHSDLYMMPTHQASGGEDHVLERRHLQRLQAERTHRRAGCPSGSRRSRFFWAAAPGLGRLAADGGDDGLRQAELADSPWLVPVRRAAEAREFRRTAKRFAFLAVEGMEPVGSRLGGWSSTPGGGARVGMLTCLEREENRLAKPVQATTGEWAPDSAGPGGLPPDAVAGDCAGCPTPVTAPFGIF